MQIDRLRELEDPLPSIAPTAEPWANAPLSRKAAHDHSAEYGEAMRSVKERASTILNEFSEAQSELIGNSVVLTDGKAGTVENVWLDDLHGLRISIKGHVGKWPVSTINKYVQGELPPPIP